MSVCVCARVRAHVYVRVSTCTCAGTVREAVRNGTGKVDRDWKGQLEFPFCLDPVLKAVTFLAGE